MGFPAHFPPKHLWMGSSPWGPFRWAGSNADAFTWWNGPRSRRSFPRHNRQSSYRLQFFAGWWFGTFFIFPYIGNNHPNWLIFFRGVETTNQFESREFSAISANLNMQRLELRVEAPSFCGWTADHRFWDISKLYWPTDVGPESSQLLSFDLV